MRLHNLCHRMHVDDQEFTLESVRLSDVDNAFPSLRYVNSQDKDSDKFIILDLSDDDALKSVLRQVYEWHGIIEIFLVCVCCASVTSLLTS